MADREQTDPIYKHRILVVDDSADIRDGLEIELDLHGYDVRTAEDAKTALAVFNSFKPDIALLDIEMPGISGIRLCRVIRKHSNIPVIMLSGLSAREVKLQALEAGADDYVIKGTDLEELLARVAGQLRWKRLPNEPVARSTDSPVNDSEENDDRKPLVEPQQTRSILVAEGAAYEGATGVSRVLRTAQRTALAELLRESGYTVYEAVDGARALIEAINRQPDLIIADSGPRADDGLMLVKALRGDRQTRRIPVMVVRDKATPDDRELALALGISDFILRPFTKADLLMRVDWVLAARGRYEKAQQKRRNLKKAG